MYNTIKYYSAIAESEGWMLFAGNGVMIQELAKLDPGNPNHGFFSYVVFEL